MSQQSQWQVHNPQQIAGGVKMFDPSQFAGTSQASNVPQQNYSQHSAASPQTSTYAPYSTAQTYPNSTQNNSWTSWGSWGEGNGVPENQSYTAHSPGEASTVHTSQAQQDYGQGYWDPNAQQQVHPGQNFQSGDGQQQNYHQQYQQQSDQQYNQYTSDNQWHGYSQNQNMIQTSQQNSYNDHQQYQQDTTQMNVGLEHSGDQQQSPHPDQYSSYLGDSFQPSNLPVQTESFDSAGNAAQVSGSEYVDNSVAEANKNSANNYFNNSDLSQSTNTLFQPSNVTSNQFLNTNDLIHRTDSAISNASLCTEGSVNTSLDQEQILQQMSGQMQNVSLEPLPEVTSLQPSQTTMPDQTSVEDVKLEEDPQSPLNDWEFVNSIPSSSSQHSRQSSLENSSNILTSQPSPGSQPSYDMYHAEKQSESVDLHHTNIETSTNPTGSNETPQTPVQQIDPFNVNISASFSSDTNSSALSSSVTNTSSSGTTSEPSSLGTSFTNTQTPDFSPTKAPPMALATSPAASNPFRKPSPKPTVQDTENINSPVIPTPIFHPLILSQDSAKDTNQDDLQEQPVSSIPFSGYESTKTEKKTDVPKSENILNSPARKQEEISSNRDSSKPPISKDTPQNSPRKHNSAFKPVHRAKHNMSPATSLWDDYSPPKITGVLLAPAAPSVTEASPISKSRSSSPVRSSARDSKNRYGEGKGSDSEGYSDNSRNRYRDRRLGSNSGRKDDDNRSLDSLDEVNSKMDSKMDSYRERRYKEKYSGRNPYYDERDRPMSRSDYRDDYRARYSRDDPYYRYSDKDYYGHERYDRPRSRNNESQEREVPESDRPKSRADYDKDARDHYYRERYRGYGYDSRRRHDDRYYDDYMYSQAYYDEYYGNQGYGARYNDYYRSQYTVGDNYSHVSNSPRAHTPALDETEPSYDSQGRLSRPSSRQDYGETSYKHEHYDPRYSQYYDQYGYDHYYQGYPYDPYANYHDTSYSRLTPPKYSIPHMKSSFGPNGQLIKVLPNRPADGQPAVVEIQEVETVLADLTGAEAVKEFPGPLIRGDTHKNDILLFCQRKAKKCGEDINMMDRESAELIWKLLELLIKQNGTVIGTDIADLLLEGHEPSTKEYSMSGMKIASSLENLQLTDDADLKTTVDKTTITNKNRDDLIDRFRHLLLYGRKKDALEWAMKNNIWGHALFLASKMDTRTHANVMTKFANSAMKMNDPLQSLYQLMSGRQPAAVTCMSDERWGDWRPHLAMILSNHTSKSDIDRKSITTLGDTLAAKGCLYASHFCYLMAQVNFGVFSKKTSKIVLISSSHNLPLDEFATNEAIQCTEIYEYAMSLGNASFVLPHLQVFKFLYACRLAEYGLSEETLRYCEVISQNVQRTPVYYQSSFVKSLYELSNRLKYHDPARQHEGEDAEDPAWLQHLSVVCNGYDDGSIQPISGTATPAGYPGTTTSSDSGEVAEYTSNTNQYQNYQQDGTYTQYDQGQGQYNQGHGQYDQGQGYYQNQYQQTGNGNGGTSESTNQPTDGQTTDYLQQLQAYNAEWSQYSKPYNYDQQQGYYSEQQQQQQQSADTTDQSYNNPDPSQNIGYTPQQAPQGYYQTSGSENQQQGYYNPQQARNSITSTQSLATEEDDDDDDDEDDEDQIDEGNNGPPPGSFDYFGAATSQQIVAPPSRFRTDSTSSTGIPPRQRTTSGSSTGSLSAANPKPKTKQDQTKERQKNNEKGSGWLNMFGWGKNKQKQKKHKEIILPDDKDPKIVWDPVTKKWTNPGEEEISAPAAPPPKDIDLMGKSSGMNGSAPPMMSSGGANRFSLKSAGGARNQYVDVLKSDSSPVPTTTLLNTAPNTTTSTNIYNPMSGSSQVNNKQSLDIPPSSQKDQPTNQTAPSMPVLFDPTQFQQSTNTQSNTQSNTAQGMKYGQRRKYPK